MHLSTQFGKLVNVVPVVLLLATPALGDYQWPSPQIDALERLLARVGREGDTLRAAAAAIASRLPSVKEQFEAQMALYAELTARAASR